MTEIPQDKIKSLFDYWHNLDKVKVLSGDEFDKQKQDIRYSICDVLAKGIDEEHPTSGEIAKRHVLNAKEIRSMVEEQLDIEIQKSNLYFHLQKLEESGLIKVVDILKMYDKQSKRKKVFSFYGRTAKVFLSSGPKETKQLKVIKDERLLKLLMQLNPKMQENAVKKILTTIGEIDNNDFAFFISWMNRYEKELINSEIDFRVIFDMVQILQFYDPIIFKSVIELSKLLKFNSDNAN